MINRKRMLSLTALFLSAVCTLHAQDFRVSGNLTNAATGQPMEFATVVLETADSIFVNGTTSAQNGSFSIENLPAGNFRLMITSIGFDTVRIDLRELSKSTDIGVIEMHETATQLAEVTVQGASVLNKSDRKMYLVNERLRAGASNGMNLITRLNMPRLVFDPYKNTVTATDNKNIEFRINDIPATGQDILALQPKDIVRVEYIDNPGLKYGAEAGYVLNYVVQKRRSGGSAGAELEYSVNRKFHYENAFAKVHRGKSEFSANLYSKSMRIGGLMRTYKETFRFEDGREWVREEIGEPTVMAEDNQNGRLAYNYTDPDKRTFNATLRYNYYANPNMDFISHSYWQHEPLRKVLMKDANSNINQSPTVDLYYQEKLKNNQTLMFNFYYSKRLSNVSRTYTETLNSEVLTDISTAVRGNRDTYIGEALYEKTFKSGGKLTSGIKHQQSYTRNTYSGNTHAATDMAQSNSYLYSEYSGKIKEKTNVTLGIGFTRIQTIQKNAPSHRNYFFQPRIRIRHHFSDAAYLGLESRLNNRTPSLSQLSDVCQPIDSLQKQCGNPNLMPWLQSYSALEYSHSIKTLDINVKTEYQYMHKPVMGEKIRENGLFVHTFDNQKSWQRAGVEVSLGYRPFGEYLVLNITGGYSHFVSVGNRYRHTFNDFYHSQNIMLNYKRLTLSFMNWQGQKWFFGEEYNANESIHIIDFTYTHPKFSTGITVMNPFTKTYKRDSENFSEMAPRQHTWYSNKVQGLALLKFSYNLRWGEEYKSARKRISNSDSESGILSGGK